MIKQTIQFKDFNDQPVTEDLHFHLSVDTITDNLDLVDEFESLQEMVSGEPRELVTSEKQRILDLVKRIIRLSFGKRSEDGKRFQAGVRYPEIWADFQDSGALDEFLWQLFQQPEKAMTFMGDVMPKDMVERARAQAETDGPKQPQDRLSKQTPEKPTKQIAVEENEPSGVPTLAERRAKLEAELAELEHGV